MFSIATVRSYLIFCLCFNGILNGYCVRIHVDKVSCLSFDKTLHNFSKCSLKSISRYVTETTINITLPNDLKTIKVKLEFLKKSINKYNPYLYDYVKFDGCAFLNKRSISPIASYIFSFMEDYTNLNHSCPYKDYILIDRFRVDVNKMKWIPMPSGDYLIKANFNVNGREASEILLYFTFTE